MEMAEFIRESLRSQLVVGEGDDETD